MNDTLLGPEEHMTAFTACQVVFEASPLKLQVTSGRSIPSADELLFIIVPQVSRCFDIHGYSPTHLAAELVLGLGLGSKEYELCKAEFHVDGQGDVLVQRYKRRYGLALAVSLDWLPTASITYLCRASGDIEVYAADGRQSFEGEASDFNRHLAEFIVEKESSRSHAPELAN